MAADELVEVIGADGGVQRVVTRAEIRRSRLRHRCTFVVVRSSDGGVLVHRRSDDKDLWPGRWDICAGGVAVAGEKWEAAALRELREEVGVEATPGELEYLGEFDYADDDVVELARVWSIEHDGPYTFTDGEVVEARTVSLAGLTSMMAEMPFVPDSEALVLPLLLGNRGRDAADWSGA